MLVWAMTTLGGKPSAEPIKGFCLGDPNPIPINKVANYIHFDGCTVTRIWRASAESSGRRLGHPTIDLGPLAIDTGPHTIDVGTPTIDAGRPTIDVGLHTINVPPPIIENRLKPLKVGLKLVKIG